MGTEPVKSGSSVILYGVKTNTIGYSLSTKLCKISGAQGDITTQNSIPSHLEYFPYPLIDTTGVPTRRFVLSDLVTRFFFKHGKGILQFTGSYTDDIDSTTEIIFDLGADFGSKILCNVKLQN